MSAKMPLIIIIIIMFVYLRLSNAADNIVVVDVVNAYFGWDRSVALE